MFRQWSKKVVMEWIWKSLIFLHVSKSFLYEKVQILQIWQVCASPLKWCLHDETAQLKQSAGIILWDDFQRLPNLTEICPGQKEVSSQKSANWKWLVSRFKLGTSDLISTNKQFWFWTFYHVDKKAEVYAYLKPFAMTWLEIWYGNVLFICPLIEGRLKSVSFLTPTHSPVITHTEEKNNFTYKAMHQLKQCATYWKVTLEIENESRHVFHDFVEIESFKLSNSCQMRWN